MFSPRNIARLIFFCADSGAESSSAFCRNDSHTRTYSTVAGSSARKPTTLSGKQASKVKIPVLAMLAAIVMQSVPAGHILLCRNPKSE